MVSRLFSGKTVDIYYGVEGTAIPTITPATGVITPGAAYSLIGQGNYADGVTFDHVDERSELMFQGGQGLPDEERRTKQGLLVTVEVYDHTPETLALALGNTLTTTPPGTTQVGIHEIVIDAPLPVPKWAILLVFGSPYDTDRMAGWMAQTHMAAATLHLGPFNGALDPEGVTMMIKQMNHATKARTQVVFADAS